MPEAHQATGKFPVTRLFPKATDEAGCTGRKESDEEAELPKGTKYVSPGGNLTERQVGTCAEFDPRRGRLKTARACQMSEGMRDACQRATREEAEEVLRRLCSQVTHFERGQGEDHTR